VSADFVRQPVTTLAQTALLPIDARAHDDPATSPLLEAAFAWAVISGQTVYLKFAKEYFLGDHLAAIFLVAQ
jgi:hypothetical protein